MSEKDFSMWRTVVREPRCKRASIGAPSRKTAGTASAQYVRRVTTVSEPELDLLSRLQEYIKWARRYAIPMTSNQYAEEADRRKWKSDDRQLMPALFHRLKSELYHHVAQNA